MSLSTCPRTEEEAEGFARTFSPFVRIRLPGVFAVCVGGLVFRSVGARAFFGQGGADVLFGQGTVLSFSAASRHRDEERRAQQCGDQFYNRFHVFSPFCFFYCLYYRTRQAPRAMQKIFRRRQVLPFRAAFRRNFSVSACICLPFAAKKEKRPLSEEDGRKIAI